MEERLGIAGSGAIASGLARVAAASGDIALWARSDASVERARAAVAKGGDEARLRAATDPSVLDDATFVVEAIVEDTAAKSELLAELGRRAGPDTILATTTSSLSVTELAQASGRPDRFVGLHVFNPVPRMDLIELVFPDQATDDTRARARELCEKLGKTAVEVPDVPGFVVNRLLFPYLFAAVDLMEETGLEAEAIDTCMKLGVGHPMGPLAVLDLVGLDVSIAIGDTIGAKVPERMRSMAAEGALGRKAGRGFYDY